MKTAISVPDEIFREVDEFAKKQNCSRSEVFVLAVAEFFEKRKAGKLLKALNTVYADSGPETQDDLLLRRKGMRHFAKKVNKETY